MARPKKETSVLKEEETKTEETAQIEKIVPTEKVESVKVDRNSFEYSSTGNIPYRFDENDAVFDLKAQTPFRINSGEVRTISAGIKVRIPDGFIGMVVSSDVNVKTQVCVLGAPVILLPSDEEKEVVITIKMFGYGYKIYNMGDKLASLLLIPNASSVVSMKK